MLVSRKAPLALTVPFILALAGPAGAETARQPLSAIDWLSRPASDIGRVFGGKPVALMGATPGPGGTILAQAAWLPVLRTLGTQPWFGSRMYVSSAGHVFGPDGALIDDQVRARLTAFVAGFAEYTARLAR